MSTKAGEKRKNQAAKRIQKSDKKMKERSLDRELKNQYFIIRDDLMKLREDITKGYDMAKEWIDKKGSVRNLLKAK